MPGGAARAWRAVRGWPLLLALALALALHAWRLKSGIDLQVYLRAGGRALRGEPLYLANEASPFKYAPPLALLFAPWSLLPVRVAQAGWLALSGWALADVVRRQAAQRGLSAWWQPVLVLVLTLPALMQVLFLGQVDVLLLWLMVLSEEREARQPLRSGAMWALVCAFKLPFLLFVLVAVGFREWRRLLGLALGAAALLAAGALRWGPAGALAELDAWYQLLVQSTPRSLFTADNQSLTAMLHVLGLEGPLLAGATLGLGTLLLAGAAAAVASRARWDPGAARLLASALTLVLATLLSPLGWLSSLVVVVPLAAALLARRQEGPPRGLATAGLAALAGVLLVNFDLLGREGYELVLGLRPFGWAALTAAACLALAPPPVTR